jgi:hypothetical protein
MPRNSIVTAVILLIGIASSSLRAEQSAPNSNTAGLRAGAASVDITPKRFPVLVNGGFIESRATRATDPLHARSLVLDDGSTRIAITVVDTCMMPRDLIDRAKEIAHTKTGIPVSQMLVSATHTHSAPAVMGALGCPADTAYAADLIPLIADAITKAASNLEPARAGWAKVDDHEHTFCRRWIRRPDKLIEDPFGQKNVRANMHPGYQNPDAIAPSGPVDPALTVLSIQSKSGRPLALLANYSMHYYGASPVSSDYFGRFASTLGKLVAANDKEAGSPFVAIMSQGTSGDQMWMDYGKPKVEQGIDAYAAAVAQSAFRAYQSIKYVDALTIASAEQTITLDRRTPDNSRLTWAREVVAQMNKRNGIPNSLTEVYAQEAIFLHDQPRRELKLQAFRIGDLGITAIPNEVFAITGLKLKAQSPLNLTMNIELANGSEGYIPPPEQHALGGYTTWPARTAALEVEAEPKIVEALLSLLEKVANKPRRPIVVPSHPNAETIMKSQPFAYWRLDDISGKSALDSSGHGRHATFEPGVAFYLPGTNGPLLSDSSSLTNRSAHFAGGRLKAELKSHSGDYSVEFWFWHGLSDDVRPISGYLFSQGTKIGDRWSGEQIGLSGGPGKPTHLVLTCEGHEKTPYTCRRNVLPRTWHHVALVREEKQVKIYLDGTLELKADANPATEKRGSEMYFGGRFDHAFNFEGKIDEIAIFDHTLHDLEIPLHTYEGFLPPQ